MSTTQLTDRQFWFDYWESKTDLAFEVRTSYSFIQEHAAFIKPGGVLLLTLPNFRGLNGWLQQTFDPDNYAKLNIGCMDVDFLTKTCASLGLKEIEVHYTGRFMIWLENINQQSWWVRVFLKVLWVPFKVIFKIIPVETRWFSPYLLLTARV